MSDNSKASAEVSALLAELDADFGKKPKGRPVAPHKALNTQWHAANPKISYAKQQIEQLKFDNYYDWEMHRQAVLRNSLEADQHAGESTLQWLPEARVTYVVHQLCACCKTITDFVGHEYIRFRGRRRLYRDISGRQHETHPTMLRKIGEVDANLIAFGMPDGDPLPDLVEEINETVRRCPGCISMEQQALDLWIVATQPSVNGELLIDIPDVVEVSNDAPSQS